MTPFAPLLAHSFRRARGLVVGFGLLLLLFQLAFVLLARTLEESNTFGQIAALVPPFVRQLLGPSFISMLSFAGIVSFGYFHPAVIAALVGIVVTVATEPAAEVERRFADLVLARPVARADVITRSAVLLLAAAVVPIVLMLAGTWAGLAWLAAGSPRVDRTLVGALALNLGALAFAWGGLTLALAAAVRRRGTAGAIAAGLALSTFVLDYLARLWWPARRVAWLSPFHYYDPMEMLMGVALDRAHVLTLVGVGVVGIAGAYLVFSKRDL
jgi:ABC-2 type transport system permease protein